MSHFQKWIPVVDEEVCNGCRVCVVACAHECLDMAGGVAVLVDADGCGSDEHCVTSCPEDAISMQWAPMPGDYCVGVWRSDLDEDDWGEPRPTAQP